MEFHREEGNGFGRYTTEVDGHTAKLTFLKDGDILVIDHVGVPRPLEGQGVGSALVQHAVEQARSRGEKLRPLCSFARIKMARRPEWQDVLA
ncbi:GNAT family N-acetyltransferase [Parvularcula maris]|uniref:N-acetyltransferase n=1 Tax=Parvularcula maris TaxID=2965077 RepID=A0A9X2LAD8_9PROT|nr:GNAT family N-acetyltransferase [Parvularcula maris]MCQ8185921.1 N-acetyltransferase [Parvularcula maris]